MTPYLLIALTLPTGPTPAPSASPPLVVEHALVGAVAEARLPARRDGVLAGFAAPEGADVAAGAAVATLDAEEADARLALADEQLAAAELAAAFDHGPAAATVAADFAAAKRAMFEAVHAGSSAALTDLTLAQAVADAEKLALDAKRTVIEHRLAGHQAEVRRAERRLAALEREQHVVLAPAGGVIAERLVEPGEFVGRGQPVARWVRMDALAVEAFVDVAVIAPAELERATATLTVDVGGGAVETFAGRITFVSPVLETDGAYRIKAEVANRKAAGSWRLRPGMVGTLSIAPRPEPLGPAGMTGASQVPIDMTRHDRVTSDTWSSLDALAVMSGRRALPRAGEASDASGP